MHIHKQKHRPDHIKRGRRRRYAIVCMLLALVCLFALNASAITPTYSNMTPAFRGSRYYLNLKALTLTGDERTDIVMVAMSQLGYHEGNGPEHCHGETCGSGNYVEYNYYHGSVDQLGNGVQTYGYPWCASFVSYCARLAGISCGTLCTSLNCARWVNHFVCEGEYYTRQSGYEPIQGDLIFFRDAGSSKLSTHVGIVRYTCNGVVYTIEGNCGNEVRLAAYDLSDPYVIGFASPDYTENPDTAIDYLLDEYTEGNYIIAAAELPVRSKPNGGRVTFTLHRGDLMHIYECIGNWGRTDYGWIPMTDTQPIDVR
ncbi:MAG: CHAP domain-containing protein [Clostridia bacterium]|nr:CHAP domain-containing protein [Clostridia bacterium]